MDTDKNNNYGNLKDDVIESALKHVVFDGWSPITLKKVCIELNLSDEQIVQLFPQGGVDLAVYFHERDDERFFSLFSASKYNSSSRRIRDRIEAAINSRIDIANQNKEAVKRSVAILTTPLYFSLGSKALWRTSDKIWTSIGDKSNYMNWYSKRLILSSVYSAVVVFWLEDDTPNFLETRKFITRRIADVMMIERIKGAVKKTPVLGEMANRFEACAEDFLKRKESFPGWPGR